MFEGLELEDLGVREGGAARRGKRPWRRWLVCTVVLMTLTGGVLLLL